MINVLTANNYYFFFHAPTVNGCALHKILTTLPDLGNTRCLQHQQKNNLLSFQMSNSDFVNKL